MRRAVLESAGRFRIEEAPTPAPGPGELLLRIRAVGICGSDLHLFREGVIGGVSIGEAGGPFVPGHECVASVEEAADPADRHLVGRRVAVEPAISCGRCRSCLRGYPNLCPEVRFLGLPPVQGCLQEYRLHRAAAVCPLPDEFDDDAGVIFEPLAVAMHALKLAGARPGRSAAVLGSGPVGLCCLMLLSRMGLSPLVATDVLDHRLRVARDLGATRTLNPERDDVPASIEEDTAGEGLDYVFECAGAAETQEQTVALAGRGGKVLVLGVPAVDELRFRHSLARRKGLTVFMVRRSNGDLPYCIRWALKEKAPLNRLVSHHFPLGRIQEAFETASAYADGVVKAIVDPGA